MALSALLLCNINNFIFISRLKYSIIIKRILAKVYAHHMLFILAAIFIGDYDFL